MSDDVNDVIAPANFDIDRLRGFGMARGRILAFSIYMTTLSDYRVIIIITRSIIVSEFEMTKSLHRHVRRFRERMSDEMGLQMFPENGY